MNWMAHLMQMLEDNIIKQVLKFKATGIQMWRRLHLKQADSLELDFLSIDAKNWRLKINRELSWKNLQKKALGHTGLSGQI